MRIWRLHLFPMHTSATDGESRECGATVKGVGKTEHAECTLAARDAGIPVPVHVVPGPVPEDARRLLLISFHFPPGATAGALRWQKMARHAASRGWLLDVISVHPEDLSRPDRARLADLPPGTRIFGVHKRLPRFDRLGKRIWDVYKSARAALLPNRERGTEPADHSGGGDASRESLPPDEITFSITSRADLRRAFHAWLDFVREGVWADDAARVGFRLAGVVDYDAVLTSGPPHMTHVGGTKVSRRAGLPLAVDLRDPWSVVRRRPEPTASPVWFRLAGRHEKSVVRAADLVIANTDAVRRSLEELYPQSRARFITVTNGADEPIDGVSSDTFFITYAGAIYLDRDPRPLLAAAASLIRRNGLSPDELRVELVGHVDDYNGVATRTIARAEGIEDYVDIHPPEPHASLLDRLSRSSVLVSLPQDSPWAIPSKIFEYMQFRAWLLVFADPDTPTWDLLADSGVDLVRPGDVEGVAEILERRFRQHRGGDEPRRIAEEEERFGRRYQADLLLDAIASLSEAPHGASR